MRLNGLFAFVAAASHAAERCCLEDSAIRWRSYNRGRRKRHESYPCLRVRVTTLLSGELDLSVLYVLNKCRLLTVKSVFRKLPCTTYIRPKHVEIL